MATDITNAAPSFHYQDSHGDRRGFSRVPGLAESSGVLHPKNDDPHRSTQERVVELLNEAQLSDSSVQRLFILRKVQELIVHKEPSLLDSFLDEMLAFQTDKYPEVRKFMITFMEDACKVDNEILPKVASSLMILLEDESIIVAKKVILAMSNFYNIVYQWIARAKTTTTAMEKTWAYINQIKSQLCELVDNDNDGIRTHAVKFLENLVLALSMKTAESEPSKRVGGPEVYLNMVPEDHPFLRIKRLINESNEAFDIILTFQGSLHISSVNLMTCMGSLTTIAKQRPQFMDKVVLSFESLHVNLPPTLTKSQVSSVRKNLKMKLLSLLKHSSSYKFASRITILLTDLGATQSEVIKALPREEHRKRRAEDQLAGEAKRPRDGDGGMGPSQPVLIALDKVDDDDDEDGPGVGGSSTVAGSATATRPTKQDTHQTAIDITAEDLLERLTPQNVADLVLLSMVVLPDKLPAHFQSTYTPISAAGTDSQIKHLARLLATQVTSAGLGPGYAYIQQQQEKRKEELAMNPEPEQTPLVPSKGRDPIEQIARRVPMPVPPPRMVHSAHRGIRQFKLYNITKPMSSSSADRHALLAVQRILSSNKNSPHEQICSELVINKVCMFGGELAEVFLQYIFADMRHRADLAIQWLYKEYTKYMAYSVAEVHASNAAREQKIASYDRCLTSLLTGVLERPDRREGLFSRILLEAPCITSNAVHVLKLYCQVDNRIYLGMTTLKELIVKRPNMKLVFLAVLLDFTCHYKPEVRNNAVRFAKKLHERPELSAPIEKSALHYLQLLQNDVPPEELFGLEPEDYIKKWTEDNIKLCLCLYLALLPVNHSIIHELASVYISATADIKRTILRVLETPVKGMGMDSPDLMLLVERCSKGAETLITRIIHILTDKVMPSPELVERVRDLYHKRVSDVRFLIPVLNGLTKEEVIEALPKLIKLNHEVLKGVFKRLLGANNEKEAGSGYSSPIAPEELLLALHHVDTQDGECDMKTVIKATNLCFVERGIYTQEVLLKVMKLLMELPTLPTLFMRTVIQALAVYPKLMGNVLQIMQKLIVKQVWKQKKVWEGFVRCCQRTKPQSFQVLLQLPATQIKSVFDICPDLREPLLKHIQGFTAHQRARIPKTILTVIEKGLDDEEEKVLSEARKAESEKLAEQESIYQKKLQEERMKQTSARSPLRMDVEEFSTNTSVKEIPLTLSTEGNMETTDYNHHNGENVNGAGEGGMGTAGSLEGGDRVKSKSRHTVADAFVDPATLEDLSEDENEPPTAMDKAIKESERSTKTEKGSITIKLSTKSTSNSNSDSTSKRSSSSTNSKTTSSSSSRSARSSRRGDSRDTTSSRDTSSRDASSRDNKIDDRRSSRTPSHRSSSTKSSAAKLSSSSYRSSSTRSSRSSKK